MILRVLGALVVLAVVLAGAWTWGTVRESHAVLNGPTPTIPPWRWGQPVTVVYDDDALAPGTTSLAMPISPDVSWCDMTRIAVIRAKPAEDVTGLCRGDVGADKCIILCDGLKASAVTTSVEARVYGLAGGR